MRSLMRGVLWALITPDTKFGGRRHCWCQISAWLRKREG